MVKKVVIHWVMFKTSMGGNAKKRILNRKGDKTVLRTMCQFYTQDIQKISDNPSHPSFFNSTPLSFSQNLFLIKISNHPFLANFWRSDSSALNKSGSQYAVQTW